MSVRVGLAAYRGDYVGAEREARTLEEAVRGSKYYQVVVRQQLAALAAVQGKLAEADRYVREGAKIDEDRGALDGYLAAMARLAQMQVQYQSAATGSATMASALARHPLATLPASDRPYTFIAMVDAMTGRGDDARRLMAEYARAVPPGVLASDPDRLAVNGYLASAAGHWADAISAFQSARVENNCVNCYLFEIAGSFGKLGQPDSRAPTSNGISRSAAPTGSTRTRSTAPSRSNDWGSSRSSAATRRPPSSTTRSSSTSGRTPTPSSSRS